MKRIDYKKLKMVMGESVSLSWKQLEQREKKNVSVTCIILEALKPMYEHKLLEVLLKNKKEKRLDTFSWE